MITYITGDIFTSDCQALVNPVNCVGVCGRGLAKEFKDRFPDNFKIYRMICRHAEMRVGKVLVVDPVGDEEKIIINFPTKLHWKQRSKVDYIARGLRSLTTTVLSLPLIKSIAVPALGCGLGGLEWAEVKPLLDEKLSGLDRVNVVVYKPR